MNLANYLKFQMSFKETSFLIIIFYLHKEPQSPILENFSPLFISFFYSILPSATSKSFIISSAPSSPTEILTRPSAIPLSALSSSV